MQRILLSQRRIFVQPPVRPARSPSLVRSCPLPSEVQQFQSVLDEKIRLVTEKVRALQKEEDTMYTLDILEELLATLNDLKLRKREGVDAMMAGLECEPDIADSVEYDV